MCQGLFLCLGLAVILSTCVAQQVQCGVDHKVGETDAAVALNTNFPEPSTGKTFILEDPRYTFDCCGVVSKWYFYTLAAGTIEFQAWRQSSGQYVLLGESIYVGSGGKVVVTYNVPISERISVQNGDYMGWYTPANHLIPYKGPVVAGATANSRIETVADLSPGQTYNWAAVSGIDGREWAVQAITNPSTAPVILNLPSTAMEIDDVTIKGTTLYTVTFNDIDPFDTLTLGFVPTSSLFKIIDIGNGSAEITVNAALTSGRYVLNVRVTDPCGKYDQQTFTVQVVATFSSWNSDWSFPAMILFITDLLFILALLATNAACMHYLRNGYFISQPDGNIRTGEKGNNKIQQLPPAQTEFIIRKRP